MPVTALATLFASALVAYGQAAPAPVASAQRGHRAALANRALLVEINRVRAAHALRPLRLAVRLDVAAVQHSEEMGERGYFEHASFDGTAFWKRVGRYYGSKGYRYWSVGENLLWSSGTLSPASAVAMWMKSPPHRKNLLDPHWRQVGFSARQFVSAPGVFQGLGVTILTADFGVRY